MTKEITINNGANVAVVRFNEFGKLEVVEEGKKRDDKRTKQLAIQQGIPLEIQKEVDEYLELHALMAELKAKQDKLKKNIRGYMTENDIKEITGTKGKQVYLKDARASNSTSRYTDYELKDVMKALYGTEYLREVTEVRVNADKLEGLFKLGKLPEHKVKEIKAMKICKQGTPRFSVRNVSK